MVSNNTLINAIRSRGYTYKGQSDRMQIWKLKGATKRILIRRHNAHDPEYAAVILRQAGFADGEIMSFMATYNNTH